MSAGRDWSRVEVEAIVADYFAMLEKELRGQPHNKTAHRRRLIPLLDERSHGSVEYKHQNISAVLIELGQPYIDGYKPQVNYQDLLFNVVEDRLANSPGLLRAVGEKVEQAASVPMVDDILRRLVEPPAPPSGMKPRYARERPSRREIAPNHLLREARNASLGSAGERFVLNFEKARLIREGHEDLATEVEHVSVTRGDHEGFDVLSFESDGRERWIEVKTTSFGQMTPFFVSRNQVEVSSRAWKRYHLYRCFSFRDDPRFFALRGAIRSNFDLEASEFTARLA